MSPFTYNPFTNKFDYYKTGLTQAQGDARYLELDTSNDPLTGNLEISKADPELRLTDTGNSEYSRWKKTDTTNYAYQYNRVGVPAAGTNCLSRDAGGEYATVNTPGTKLNFAGTLTWAFWYKNTVYALDQIYGQNEGSGDPPQLTVRFVGPARAYMGAENILGTTNIGDGAWHSVIVTRDSGNVFTLYVDGVSEGTPVTLAGTITADGTGARFGYSGATGGEIDEARLLNICYNQTQIDAYHNGGAGSYGSSTETGLVAGWHFDEGSGTNADNYQGDADLDCTLSGGAGWGTGLVVPTALTEETTIWSSKDGVLAGEKGIQTYGDIGGRSILEGLTTKFNIAGTEQLNLADGVLSPSASYDVDLGTSTIGFKDLYLRGKAHFSTSAASVSASYICSKDDGKLDLYADNSIDLNGDVTITGGAEIGDATTDLIGFYGATAVDQPATVSDAATQDLTGTDTIDRAKTEADLTSCKNAINAIIDRLQELGLIA